MKVIPYILLLCPLLQPSWIVAYNMRKVFWGTVCSLETETD